MSEPIGDGGDARVILVEDDPLLAKNQKLQLNRAGFSCEIHGSGEDALAAINRGALPHVIVLDMLMPGIGGLETLKRIRRFEPGLPVIVVSGQDKVSTAIETIREGAYDYLIKPVSEQSLTATVRHAVSQRQVSLELTRLRREVRRAYTFDRLIGRSASMHKVFKLIERTLTNDIAVLILGESGTGKELVARAIHYNGQRAAGARNRTRRRVEDDQGRCPPRVRNPAKPGERGEGEPVPRGSLLPDQRVPDLAAAAA
ncbi:MAG: Regulatory protein AtoC [Calditrichaeota bacterium]|nr:Regulatory protein AtoC [Calditrichota bacterium]